MSVPGLLFGMSSQRVILLALLAFSVQGLDPAGKERLQPPRNLKLVSEDFKLFLTWQPADNYPSGVSYTVKWRNPYTGWSTTHCINISDTFCDITCVNPKLNSRFWVQVEALERTGRTSKGVLSGPIDYDILVELAPPVLQVRRAERDLVVNTTFTYPDCVKGAFKDLNYDLEYWENGTKPKKRCNLVEKVVNISTTAFSGDHYCLRARAFLRLTRKASNFSEPVCGLLNREEESWRLIVLLSLLLLIFPAGGAVIYFSWCKNPAAKFKTPQVLDFSSYKGPKRFLEFGEIKTDVIMCERARVISEIRRRPAAQINLPLVPSEFPAAEEDDDDDDEDEDDDDSGSPIPYTELRFPKKDTNCQGVEMGQKAQDPPSESDSSQSDGGCCFPDVMGSKPFISTELVTAESTSELQGSKSTSLSGSSSAEESLVFPVGCHATRGWEDTNGVIDFSIQLSTLTEGGDLRLPTETQFVTAEDFPEGSWGDLEDSQMPLLRIQGHKDSCGILLEEKTEEDIGFESASSGGGRLMKEMLLLKASSLEDVESCTLGGSRTLEEDSVPGTKFHGYHPRHSPYISRVGLG